MPKVVTLQHHNIAHDLEDVEIDLDHIESDGDIPIVGNGVAHAKIEHKSEATRAKEPLSVEERRQRASRSRRSWLSGKFAIPNVNDLGEGSVPYHCWRNGNHDDFPVRVGPNYKKYGKKAPSLDAMYKCIGVATYFTTDENADNSSRPVGVPPPLGLSNDVILPQVFIVHSKMEVKAPTTHGEISAVCHLVQYHELTEEALAWCQNCSASLTTIPQQPSTPTSKLSKLGFLGARSGGQSKTSTVSSPQSSVSGDSLREGRARCTSGVSISGVSQRDVSLSMSIARGSTGQFPDSNSVSTIAQKKKRRCCGLFGVKKTKPLTHEQRMPTIDEENSYGGGDYGHLVDKNHLEKGDSIDL